MNFSVARTAGVCTISAGFGDCAASASEQSIPRTLRIAWCSRVASCGNGI